MNAIKQFAVIFSLFIAHHHAYATTYYIDSKLGNDMWSGKRLARAASTSTDGPWQSLNRLAAATLSPGDIVELQCGSKWIQTLRLNNSGTAGLPITIRAASSACGTPPSIDGSQVIDAHSWLRHSDTIDKAAWPNEKLQNGSLASEVAGWSSWSAAGDQKLVHEANCPDSPSGCAAFTSSVKPGGSLVNSNTFQVQGGVAYRAGLSLRAPAGIQVKILVRRGSPPYDPISAVQWIAGTGAWQKISIAFIPRSDVTDARLDIENPPEGVKFHFRSASLTPAFATPLGAWAGDLPLLPAHHPNRGHDATSPNSVYARAAGNGNSVSQSNGAIGSTYIDIGSSLKLSDGTMPRPGNRLRIRTAPWHLDEVTITRVDGDRLHFEPATRYQIEKGQGYFLLDELVMLDSPGEWLYDSNTAATYAWVPDSNAPSRQMRLSVLEKGIDLSGRANIVVEGIDVRYTAVGLDLTDTQNLTLRSASISNTVREGIVATNARNVSIISNRIRQTGRDAISAPGAKIVRVEENDINQSAVAVVGDRIWSLPATTYATVYVGAFATIKGNRINFSASNGIWTQANEFVANGVIENNAVLNSCLQINDCGAIYVNYSSPNTRIASNLIERVSGNVDGIVISRALSHGVGIYLDIHSRNMAVENNTVAWADYGIHVNDAYSNRIVGNLLYGNRNNQIFFQERTQKIASTGDVNNNDVFENSFFPTTSAPAIKIEGEVGDVTHFGVLSKNYYSALFSKRMLNESWAAHNLTYTLGEWQGAPSNKGRVSQDVGSSQIAQEGYASYLAAGGNIVPNGDLTQGMRGWSSWNQTEPFSTRTHQVCEFGPCLRITAGGTVTLAHTPMFSVEAGRSYRVSFDAKIDMDGQFIKPLVRRGGPLLYERLMPASEGFAGSTEWRRYAFVFTAAKTIIAGDPATGDLGARLDFENILPGQSLWVANMEIVPLLAAENTVRTQLVTNPDRVTRSRECPDEETAPEYCGRYHLFPQGTPVNWPIDLPPLSGVSIYTVNEATRDSDGDGIADSADRCPGTAKTDQVNASGCALTQLPDPT
ncbi:right-handed parallel beta-helix repeat-containing protein [Nitrosospira sp. Nsp14]|uniref:right-handed parallel beta-helix repeat-containing protein n=1 Tax=Nitrosospira sp. Nsp14 TaxID=1855333 RepID=UPI0015A4F61B|nr:right-handed parallel beta-helix repeat-containing protein [Nitrosospira sp. Nsp14]